MAAVPATRTWVAGEVVLASHFNNNIRDVLNFLLTPPIFKGRQTAAQTLTTGVATAISLDTEDVDSAGGHSTVTNTSRYTAVYAGWYSVGSGVSYAANATGIRTVEYDVNGAVQAAGGTAFAATGAVTNRLPGRSFQVFLNVGDYVETFGFQNSGGNLATAVLTTEQSGTVIRWESN